MFYCTTKNEKNSNTEHQGSQTLKELKLREYEADRVHTALMLTSFAVAQRVERWTGAQ